MARWNIPVNSEYSSDESSDDSSTVNTGYNNSILRLHPWLKSDYNIPNPAEYVNVDEFNLEWILFAPVWLKAIILISVVLFTFSIVCVGVAVGLLKYQMNSSSNKSVMMNEILIIAETGKSWILFHVCIFIYLNFFRDAKRIKIRIV